MSFKVGDKVRVLKSSSELIGKFTGKVATVVKVYHDGLGFIHFLDFPNNRFAFFTDELELVSSPFSQSFPESSLKVVKKSDTETLTKGNKMSNSFELPPHVLVQHVKKGSRRVGTVVALKIGDDVRIGWSKCNVNIDTFDPIYGVQYAIMSAMYDPSNVLNEVPDGLRKSYRIMADRARRYFLKIGNFKKDSGSKLMKDLSIYH